MELAKALNALEPFLALTKSATSPLAAVDLVKRATSAPNTYIFTELLETPPVQNLASSPEHAPYLQLLQIFSFGTYADFTRTPNLPALNDVQTRKLRQLSLLSLARGNGDASSSTNTTPHPLSYAALAPALGLSSARELEDLVISAVYAGLLDAQLDPKSQAVRVHSVSALRDVAPGAIAPLLASLQAWAARCDETLAELEGRVAQLRADADRRASEAARWKTRMEKMVDEEKKEGKGAGNGGAAVSFGDVAAVHHILGAQGSLQGGFGGGPLAAMLQGGQGAPRYGKRGSGHMDGVEDGGVDDEAMDVDDEAESSDGKKRASRRKLQG